MVPFPALPVSIQLVPFLHHDPEVLFGAGGFLQPPYGLGPNLPFQPLFADRGGFFFLVLQLRFIVDGMLVQMCIRDRLIKGNKKKEKPIQTVSAAGYKNKL